MPNPDRDELKRRIVAALPECNDVELEQLVKMVTAIEQRRTIHAMRELRDAQTYVPMPTRSLASSPFGRNHD